MKKFRRIKKRPTLKKRPKPSPPKRRPKPRPIMQETLVLTPAKEPSIESSSSSESCDLYGELMEGFEIDSRPKSVNTASRTLTIMNRVSEPSV